MKRKVERIIAGVLATVSITACGDASYRSDTSSTSKVSNKPSITFDGSGTTTTTTGGTSTSTGTGVAPVTMKVEGSGYNAVSVRVTTRKILKVKFTPGRQDRNVAGTGYTLQYSGLGVYIGVGSKSESTALLHNGYNGTQVETSQVMDFSSSFTPSCDSSGNNCTPVEVTITVSKPNWDYQCLQAQAYGYINSPYCPWATVNSGMTSAAPWNGTLTIQTDGTDAI